MTKVYKMTIDEQEYVGLRPAFISKLIQHYSLSFQHARDYFRTFAKEV